MKKRNFSLYIGIFLVSIILFLFLLSFVALPYEVDAMDTGNRFAEASRDHILGTDQFGRDIYSRILVSTRSALAVGVTSVFFGALVGLIIGAVAALSPKAVEVVVMRGVDAMMLSAILGKGVMNASIAISFFMVPVFARLSYSMILENGKKGYIKAARSYGVSLPRLLVFHMLPDMLTRLVTQFSSSLGAAILTESSLSFLGLGIQPPGASLGLMLSEAKAYVLIEPYQALWPGVVLSVAVLGFSLLGDGINAVLSKENSRE